MQERGIYEVIGNDQNEKITRMMIFGQQRFTFDEHTWSVKKPGLLLLRGGAEMF